MKLEVAHTQSDWVDALALATEIFNPQSVGDNYAAHKATLWQDDPTFATENLVLARDGSGKIVGMVRLVPRVMYGLNEELTVAGFSSICIHPEMRGKGHSTALMKFAIEIAKDRGFDIALLFARRAMDHYYTQFGFWGASSYNRLTVNIPEEMPLGEKITLTPPSLGHVSLYNRSYLAAYAKVFGRMARDEKYWQNIIKYVPRRGRQLSTVVWKGQEVGYVILENETVVEIAISETDAYVSAVSFLASELNQKQLTFVVSADHAMIAWLEGFDISISYRECAWGGHMVRLLGMDAGQIETPSYAQTIQGLGMRAVSRPVDHNGISLSPFNVCMIDEF